MSQTAAGTALQLPAGLAGTRSSAHVHEIDARWLMAYAAGLGELDPRYLDTLRPEGITGHPLFPVCYEWPPQVELRGRLPEALTVRSVHATHDLALHRPIRPGDRLRTQAVVVAVSPRRAGALLLTRLETVDARDRPVSTTWYGSVFRDVGCQPEGEVPERLPAAPPLADGPAGPAPRPRWSAALGVPAGLAHVYTECARIWNPVHTDRAVAVGAGLPDIILHGTATLALAVGEVLRRDARGPATRVLRVVGRFGGMVRLPSTLTVEGLGVTERPEGRWLAFQARSAEGRPAVRDGAVLVEGGR